MRGDRYFWGRVVEQCGWAGEAWTSGFSSMLYFWIEIQNHYYMLGSRIMLHSK